MKSRDAMRSVKDALLNSGIPEAEAKARVIVSHVLGIGLAQVFLDSDVSDSDFKLIESMAGRCASGEPVEYVTGKAYFRYLTLDVSPDVLIPRKETELVAEKAIELIKKYSYKTVLDLCTGSGCIAVSIAKETESRVGASDISEKALRIAKKNAEASGACVNFISSDMFGNIEGAYDIIVSNPPYVSEKEYNELDRGVRDYEPKTALIAEDGLRFYRIIAAKGLKYINPGGALVLEIGCDQAQSVTKLLENGGFTRIECFKDYEGRDRIVCAFKGA